MHGRLRSEYKAFQRDPKQAAKLAAKAQSWHQLQAELLKRRDCSLESSPESKADQSKDPTTDSTKDRKINNGSTQILIEKAVRVNPDPLWLWNFRRELLMNDEENSLDWNTEATVTHAALTANPKAYAAWHHRKWCLTMVCCCQQKNQDDLNNTILKDELELTAQFFQRDERNFHCWSYRRFVVSLMLNQNSHGEWKLNGEVWMGAQIADRDGVSVEMTSNTKAILQKEWDFTESKIRDNFSNFSAFHYRSKLLPVLYQEPAKLKLLLEQEFDLVANAVFTEPDDQTAWWYQRFLLDFVRTCEAEQTLKTHIGQLRELLDECEGSKWVLLGILQCLQFTALPSSVGSSVHELRDILEKLLHIDPDRCERYRHLLRQFTV